jgi:hypothetical protein
MPRALPIRFAGLFAVLLLPPVAAFAKPAGKFIWLSDVHFDPTANPKLVDTLVQASIDEWPRILASSPPARFPQFGEDTNWLLLSSAFDSIRKTASDVQFAIVTGDLLAHHLHEKFQNTAKEHDEEAFQRFSRKTIEFVGQQLLTLIPGKPVLFTLGNNDNDCVDYELHPNGAFLNEGAAWFRQLLGSLASDQSNSDWIALGSYNVAHPSLKRYRIIAVNSIYFSPKYRDACTAAVEGDPAQEEMHWLESQLAAARNDQQKVWLILHIPPGVDGYTTAHTTPGTDPKKIVWMWKPTYTEQFRALLTRFHGTVTISLAAHEHMDDFRLIDNSLVLLTPALSPIYQQNPAFRLVDFKTDGTLSNDQTYYLSDMAALLNGAAPEWKLEYSYAATWQLPQLDFKNFRKLYQRIELQPEARAHWMTLYSVSHPAGNAITPRTFPWLFCASGNTTEPTYDSCVAHARADQNHK